MKAKDIILTMGEERVKIGTLSNNKKCTLIIQLINERNHLKEELKKYTSNNVDSQKIG